MKKAELKYLPIEKLQRGKYQPRRLFNQEALEELAESIREQGIIEPIVVRLVAEDQYEIIAGERRWRASQLVDLHEVPCLVRQCSDDEAAEISLIENIQRQDLNPIEEADAYQRLIDEFGYIHEEIARAVGKSRAKITNMLRLLNLDEKVQALLKEGVLSGAHGKVLAGLGYHEQKMLALKAVKNQWSVRKLEQEVKRLNSDELRCSDNDPNVERMERLLTENYGSKVSINYDQNGKGKLVVDFSNYEILQGVLSKMGYSED
jgi:ParB family chromosome partitioning protein